MAVGLAILGGISALLIIDGLRPRRARIRLTEADRRPLMQRMIDAFFIPASRRIMSVGGRFDLDEHRDALALRLARAGYPPPFTSPDVVMGYRLFTALFAAAAGAIASVRCGSMAIPFMGALAIFGWGLPDRVIAGAEQARVEQLMLDASATLDRLAIFVAAGNALPAAVMSLTERPGGIWVAIFDLIAARYASSGDFPGALEEVSNEMGNLPEITRVLERLKAAYEMGGGGVAVGLRRMAADARIRVKHLITERGYRNAVAMVIPAFFALVAMLIVFAGPGAARLILALTY